jgi:hypothetical protein
MEKVTTFTPYSQRFQVLRYLFNILKLNSAIYMPREPSLFHYHNVVLFIFKILLFKTKDLNSIKMMWNHTKPETLPPIIRHVRCLCENIILYRYQVTLIVLDYFLYSNNILKDTKKF